MDTFSVHTTNEGCTYLAVESLNKIKGVQAYFSTKLGGVSLEPYESLNLGLHTKDLEKNVIKNFDIFCKAIHIDTKQCVLSHQVHKDHIKIVTYKDQGKGYVKPSDIKEIDGLITNCKDIALVTVFADCVPIYIVDPIQKVIALAHAGWRGTVLKIGKKVIQMMNEQFQTNPKDCKVAIGPSIGKCCYEVDQKVVAAFNAAFHCTKDFITQKSNGKYTIDLWKANACTLKEIGVMNENIVISGLCTKCHEDLFYSYRRDGSQTGRMAAILKQT